MLWNFRIKILLIITIILFLPLVAEANYLGQKVNFFIDSSYDLEKREQISATLQKISSWAYFYIDDKWWDGLDFNQKNKIISFLDSLGNEFDSKIYPTLISTFGSIPTPGIDGKERITILIHPMIEEAGGYFNSGDGYSKFQNPKSNEREMIYLNARHIDKDQARNFLAHEFMHLITFNQKDILRKVSEEIWLNELRAEIAITFLGYDEIYERSNLQRRIKNFLERPHDSLTEWLNSRPDYGIVNLFGQYLIDHYGIKILVDSLHSQRVGIPSLNEALAKNGFKEDFSQIFTDWKITVLVNDCNLGPKYCYKNPNLKNLKISPLINFLPIIGESVLSITHRTSHWAGNWHKIVGGKGTLTLEFDGSNEAIFKVPYLVCKHQGDCSIQFLNLDREQNGKIVLPEFNTKYSSLIIVPSIQTKFSGFDKIGISYLFSWKASIAEKTKEEKEAKLIEELLSQIDFLQKEIVRLRAEIDAILTEKTKRIAISCQKFEKDLYYGIRNSSEVRCLQEFLKAQGPEIYPEGLVTGNFLSLTRLAVIRFQEKYKNEILKPANREKGTGYVGFLTRAKINQILGF